MIICNIAPRTLAIILAVAAVAVTMVIWYVALCAGHDDDFDDDGDLCVPELCDYYDEVTE